MKYTLENWQVVNIPDNEIETACRNLELTKEEAIEMWLEDNDYAVNEEQNELDAKAKKVKIKHGAKAKNSEKKPRKPRTVHISDEKTALFQNIAGFLNENYENVEILKENKLFCVKIAGKSFKIDLIEQRNKK